MIMRELAEDYTDPPTEYRRVNSSCPFCNAEPWHRTTDMILYRCGTIGCHVTGNHTKGGCLSPALIQWGPL